MEQLQKSPQQISGYEITCNIFTERVAKAKP